MDSALKIKMYKDMLRIRKFEEKLCELFVKGELPGFLHLYLGEEAVAVGTCSVLNNDDYITSTHRGHGHVIAKGAEINRMMAELYGKSTGYNKGKGGSMHIAEPKLGILGANGIVGAGIPLATGAALSAKYQKNNRVAVCFFGDGASNQGTFHEAINIAAAYSLPCVYVCENNLYGANSKFSRISKTVDIASRAAGYGIPGVIVDGNDVEKVYNAISEAVERARKGEGPTLIECKTYRWMPHCEGVPDYFRPDEEKAEWKAKEPIKRYEAILIEEGILNEKKAKEIKTEVNNEIEQAVLFAKESPEPELHTALEDVYAD
jgi:acetoin:2,6-dichlorophenolindophenol oxidoreductase subunit alpha